MGQPWLDIIAFSIGAALASFVGVLVDRWFLKEPWKILWGRSFCNTCSTPLSFLEIIPVFSWIYCRGRCLHCDARILWVYPVTELGLGLLLVLFVAKGIPLPFFFLAVLSFWLAWMDLRYQQLPLIGLLLVAVLSFWESTHIDTALFLGLVGLFCFWRKMCASGDVLLFMTLGLWVPLVALPTFLILAGIFIASTGFVLQKNRFPLAPPLFLAFWLSLVV